MLCLRARSWQPAIPGSWLAGLVACAVTAAGSSCGGGSEPSPVVDRVVVGPPEPVLDVSETLQLTAQALDADGGAVAGATPDWSSSDPGIATVSETGLVLGEAAGTTVVRARIAQVEGSVTVTVRVPMVTVIVQPADATIPTYGTLEYTATGLDSDNQPVALGPVTWSVTPTNFASIAPGGTVTALGPGTVTVKATVEGGAATATLTIGPPAVAAVEIRALGGSAPAATAIPLRASEPYGALTYDVKGNILNGRMVTWSSSNPSSVSIDLTGMARAVAPGASQLVATSEGIASTPVGVSTLVIGSLVELSAGDFRSCAIEENGEALCWGANAYDELGGATAPSGDGPVLVAGDKPWTQTTSGAFHSCGVTSAGEAYCWGRNTAGQLGDGTTTDRPVPTPVVGGLEFQAISAGSNFTCGVTTGNEAYCWGSNSSGQLGTGTASPSLTPALVQGSLAFRSISTSRLDQALTVTTCAVTTTGVGYCWGGNNDGQLGTGDSTSSAIPRAIAGGHQWAEVSASTVHACGVTTAGVAYCWGANPYGAFGDGTLESDPRPTPVNGGPYITVSAGYLFTCAIEAGGGLVCFGMNEGGQVGINYPIQSELPVHPVPELSFAVVRAGRSHACALTTVGVAYCWGGTGNGSDGIGLAQSPLKVVGQP